MLQGVPRADVWRMNYGLRRYLDHSSDKKIADRLRYMVENLTTPSPDGKVGASVPNPHGSWLELFAHIQEEYRLRKAEFPADVLKGRTRPKSARSPLAGRGPERFGDEGYAMEELVAELGSAFLSTDLELTPEVRTTTPPISARGLRW